MVNVGRSSVLDACVLIDFCQEDSTLLALAARHLGRIIVLSPVLKEVRQLDEAECERLGLSIHEPDMELLLEASERRGGLSLRDRLCLAFAKKETCILYTNDKPLLSAASCDGVDARWGLQILIDLVSIDELTRHDALTAAQNICDRSRFHADGLVEEFRHRLKTT